MSKVRAKSKPSVGIYGRKFAFFATIFVVFLIGRAIYVDSKAGADVMTPISTSTGGEQVINIEISIDGNIIINGKDSGNKLKAVGEFDELRMPVIDKPENYINNLSIYVKLPKPVAAKVSKQILAIHGVDSSYTEVLDESTIRYKAYGVSQTATVSVVAKLPKGIIGRSIFSRLFSASSDVKFSFWIYLSLSIPVFTFLFMFLFINYTTRLNHVDKPDRPISSPPMAIPPALVGVLYHQRVTAREIAATLIDLALRKDIYILDRERGFAFGKGRFDKRLLGYEKLLLAKIFRNNMTTSQDEIHEKVQSQIYSKKVSLLSAGIYAITTRLGYFRENPRKVHARYWLFGILAIVVGLIGFMLSFVLRIMPSFTSLFWVGMMIAAIIIMAMASRIPIRTEIGNDALANWLAFRKYLSDSNPIEFTPTVHQLFEAYLPYAIVLDCEAAWARRFTQQSFMLPDWFVTDKNGLAMQDFCLALFPIVSYVGRSLAAMREPGFE